MVPVQFGGFMIQIKRAYEKPSKDDGMRILVDHLWPRGVSKEEAHLHEWMKEVSPSTELREWFEHDPSRWEEFKKKYFAELKDKKEHIEKLIDLAKHHTVTLVYGAHEEKYNNAVALKEYLEREAKSHSGSKQMGDS